MRYAVSTWDTNLQDFTDHDGVACRHLTPGGLKRTLQQLRRWGYPCDYNSRHHVGDPSVLVEQDTYPLVKMEAVA